MSRLSSGRQRYDGGRPPSRQRSAPNKSPPLPPPPPHPEPPEPSRPDTTPAGPWPSSATTPTTPVNTYLTTDNLAGQIDYISARTPADAARLKPHPHLITHALNAPPTACVLIGDSITDIQAAHAAGVPAIGYANKADKPPRFTHTGAVAVITCMIDLAAALRSI